jgi:CubicO group peptidase (beta-lactamase class C family)
MDARVLARIDDVMAAAIDARQTSGGVVVVGRKGGIVFEKAYGFRAVVPTKEEMTVDTVFDLASVTKCVATASAVMKLVEQGRIRLNDPVETYIPEWKRSPDETARNAEIARAKRMLRLGALRLGPDFLETADIKTTPVPGQKTSREKPSQLWRRLVRSGSVRPSEKFIDDLLRFEDWDRESITVRQLLTHTSGLDPFDNYYLKFTRKDARKRIISDITCRPLQQAPGEKFVYSDLGFITLGEIVERVTGDDLNTFCRREILEPLGMKDTMFNPPSSLLPRVAPTEWRTQTEPGKIETLQPHKYMIRGEVHDGNAWLQSGISGHAGLFSTAHDLAVFCQMLLNGGEYNGVRIFSPLTVRAMTADQARLKGGTKRGYGWDVSSPYAGQRGDIFADGFGHTGWTGTSVWVVPGEQLFIVILTSRCHPDGTGDAGPLRAKIANVVAAGISEPLSHSSTSPKEDQQ